MARDRGRRRRSEKEAAITIQEEAVGEEEEEYIEEEEEEEEEEQTLAMDDDDESDLFFKPHSLPRTSSPPPHPTSNNKNSSRSIIYFLLTFLESTPVSQALYAVDASSPPILQPHSTAGGGESTQSSEKIIYPVFEFMKREGFPDRMSCAVLGSSIYFVGGYFFEELPIGRVFSEKVYRIDASNMPLNPTNPRSVLQEVASMTSGKPQCYCFVALGQLFAIGVHDRRDRNLFEVYDPKLDNWTPLKDPPICSYVLSGTVVDNMVILVTGQQNFYSFDAATHEWKNLAHLPGSTATSYMGVIRRGIFLDDTIYWNNYTTLISSGPTSRVDPAEKVNDFMTQIFRSASEELADVICDIPIYNCFSTRLQYLGNRIFAFVISGAVGDSEDPYLDDCPGDPEKSKASIVVFEIPKEDVVEEEEDTPIFGGSGSEDSGFKVNILHTARFECRSNKGADHTDISLEECFSVF